MHVILGLLADNKHLSRDRSWSSLIARPFANRARKSIALCPWSPHCGKLLYTTVTTSKFGCAWEIRASVQSTPLNLLRLMIKDVTSSSLVHSSSMGHDIRTACAAVVLRRRGDLNIYGINCNILVRSTLIFERHSQLTRLEGELATAFYLSDRARRFVALIGQRLSWPEIERKNDFL